jgi:hypothetical protein
MPSKPSQRRYGAKRLGVTPMYQLLSKMRSQAVLVGLILLLSGCSTVQIVRELPPVELLADCPNVVEAYQTNGQLALTILAYRDSLVKCNIDKQALREWAEQP